MVSTLLYFRSAQQIEVLPRDDGNDLDNSLLILIIWTINHQINDILEWIFLKICAALAC